MLLRGVPGRGPAGTHFWRILKVTERYFLHIYADALSSSNSVSCHIWLEVLGELPLPTDVEPTLHTNIIHSVAERDFNDRDKENLGVSCRINFIKHY